MRTKRWLIALGLTMALGGACSGAGDTDDAGQAAPAREQPGEAAPGTPRAGDAVAQAARSVVRTGDLALRVDDVDRTATRAVEVAEDAGGFLAGQQLRRTEDGAEGTLELRVPEPAFTPTMDSLAGLGTVITRNVDTEDITGAIVDLESRLETARASVERVRALLAQASSIDEVVHIEDEVAQREAAAELLAGQLELITSTAELSSIVLRLGEVVPPPPASDPEPLDDIPGFGTGLDHGWARFQDVVSVVLTVAGFLLPFVLATAPVGGAVLWWRRRQDGGTTS